MLGALAVVCALSQAKMTVAQLRDFLKSSVQLHQPDKQVAQYLKQITLSNKLDEDAYSALLGLGLGDKTVEALRALYDGSRNLPTAPPAPVAVVARPIPPPSEAAQRKLIEDTRAYAINYSKSLPNFICTQVTRRFADPTGLEFYQREDQIVAQLTYFEEKEEYKVKLVDNQVVDTTMDRLGGTTSSGEFGSMMKEIFEPKTETDFRWLRWATMGGRRAHVISYDVRVNKGDMSISARTDAGFQSTKAGYKGLIYVERDSGVVLRITQDAVDIEPGFPIQEAGRVLDYDLVDIAGSKHMLPTKFTTRLRSGKLLTKNEVEFRSYRKYGTESSIVFDTDDLEKGPPVLERQEMAPTN
jgi:hypothetical protein